jgi:hypothetical protein
MDKRLELQTILEDVLGSRNVYFQPPESIKLNYPCILYFRTTVTPTFANNLPYTTQKQYLVTVIDSDPDSVIPDKVQALPKTIFERHYKKDDLNHDVYKIYY